MDQVKICFKSVHCQIYYIPDIGASSENNFRTNSLKSRKEIAADPLKQLQRTDTEIDLNTIHEEK